MSDVRPSSEAQAADAIEAAVALVKPIRVHGDLADRLAVISRAEASLVVGIGNVAEDDDDRPVLVPYVELSLHEQDDEDASGFDPSSQFIHTVSHENAAFVIMRLSGDFEEACGQLRAVSMGGIKPEPNRLRLARVYVDRAREHLERCVRELDATIDQG